MRSLQEFGHPPPPPVPLSRRPRPHRLCRRSRPPPPPPQKLPPDARLFPPRRWPLYPPADGRRLLVPPRSLREDKGFRDGTGGGGFSRHFLLLLLLLLVHSSVERGRLKGGEFASVAFGNFLFLLLRERRRRWR
ncbi:hypothetical protein HPP92_024425 [Vanilla planifolia]|uniref:Uncharacterized protein n=1 Tax=Vanilla planifolia TaxID=51239 RepID=A0A835UCK5_VANPL|nr:hypothetical protein HPP92_024736 [Vanilla planifolia]KAG0456637.1 hypothetical protein HPP92_024425 [Vanilla planifolia]